MPLLVSCAAEYEIQKPTLCLAAVYDPRARDEFVRQREEFVRHLQSLSEAYGLRMEGGESNRVFRSDRDLPGVTLIFSGVEHGDLVLSFSDYYHSLVFSAISMMDSSDSWRVKSCDEFPGLSVGVERP